MHQFASVALVDRRGWILMQERDEHPVIDPECWGFPGGHVEAGESYEQAAYRELAEETGVRLTAGLQLFGDYRFFSESCGEYDEFALFVAGTDRTEVECHEGRRMVFVDPEATGPLPLTRLGPGRPARPALLRPLPKAVPHECERSKSFPSPATAPRTSLSACPDPTRERCSPAPRTARSCG